MIKIFSEIKISIYAVLMLFLTSAVHPYYVSVTEIKYKESEKTLQISCRTFTDNMETTLKKIHSRPVDLLHPKDKPATDKMLSDYIASHLKISVNGKPLSFKFLGYEKEEEAVWTYLEIKNVPSPKKISIENTLLYEYLPAQINMVHAEVKDKKQSSKVANPDKKIDFTF